MKTIIKKSLVDQVYDSLKTSIVKLERKPGSKLSVAELQAETGVSCTPIREALNRLQQDGIITYENNVGAHIVALKPHDIDEIMQLGNTLHCAAARLSMKLNRTHLLSDMHEQYDDLLKAKTDDDEILAIHHFIGTFYWNCGNERLDKSMTSLRAQQLMVRNMAIKMSKERREEIDDFVSMISLAENDDTEGLCNAIESYSTKITEKAKKYLEQSSSN